MNHLHHFLSRHLEDQVGVLHCQNLQLVVVRYLNLLLVAFHCRIHP